MFRTFDLRAALIAVFEFAESLNKFIDTTKPWELVDVDADQLEDILFQVAESLRTMAILLHPFFAPKMEELLERIGAHEDVVLMKNGQSDMALNRKT